MLLQEPVKPDLVRDLKPGRSYSYAVKLTTIGDQIARHEYDLSFKVTGAAQEDMFPVHFVMTNLRSTFGKHVTKKDVFGTVTAEMGATGYPVGLSFHAGALPFSMPLLAFWLPEDAQAIGKSFATKTPLYDETLTLEGTARLGAAASPLSRLTTDLNFKIAREDPDHSAYRKLNMVVHVDTRDALPVRAEGKFTAPNGTVSYTFQRK